MAGWDDFPIVTPAAPTPPAPPRPPEQDPWAAFPVVQPSAAPPPPVGPAQPAPIPAEFADLPVPGYPGTPSAAAPAAPTEPNMIDQIMGGVDYADNTGANFLQSARRGVSNTLGLPVDLVNLGLSALGMGSDMPFGGSQSIDNALTGFGLVPEAPEPTDGFQRVIARTGQELGAMAVPAAGIISRFGGIGLQAAKEAPGLARLFGAEAAAVNPGAFLGKEAMFATGAGMGAGLANEAFGNQDQENPWIDAGGAVFGAGATGLGSAVLKSATDIGRAFAGRGSFQDEVVKEAVMRDLAASAGVTAKEGDAPDLTPIINATDGPRVSDTIPGYQESLADRTKIPGIAALEYSRQSGPNAGTYTQQRAANTQAVDNALSPLEPDATPGQFSSALETQRANTVKEVTGARDAAQVAFDNATRDLMPALTAEGRGANIRTALQDASDAAKEILGEAWRPLDEADQSVDVDILRATFDDAASTVPKALQPKLPAAARVPSQLVGDVAGGNPPVDIPEDIVQRLAAERASPGLAAARDLLSSADVPPSLKRRAEAATANGQFDFGKWQEVLDAAYMLRQNGALSPEIDDALYTLDDAYMKGGAAERAAKFAPEVRQMLAEEVDFFRDALAKGTNWTPETSAAGGMVPEDVSRAAYDIAQMTGPAIRGSSTIMQPLSEVMGIRSALTDDLRAAGATPQQKRLINDHITRLDNYLEANIPAELREQYETARAATRDFNDRFTRPQSAIGQTLAEREGQPRSPDSTVAGRFVQSDQGRIADFEALMREAGSDERVQTAVRDQILQDVQSRGLLDNPQALNDYLGQYGTVFGKFPDLKTQLGNAGSLRTALTEAQTNADNTIRQLTQPGQERAVANYLSYGDERAEQAMKGVLASRDPAASIDELLAFVGDKQEAVSGARKVFWDIMQGKSRAGGRTTQDVNGNQPWSSKALADFLENPVNAAVAERLYRDNPEHLARIREIAEALKGVDVRNAAKAPNSSGTAQGLQSNLLTPEALQSRGYAYMSGRISGTFLVTSIVSVLVRRGVRKAQEQGYQRMMDDILTNADTAALMMRENNPAARQALARKAKGWFGNEASTIINALSEGDDEDETNAAIMRMEALN